jgi:hypothetical protein
LPLPKVDPHFLSTPSLSSHIQIFLFAPLIYSSVAFFEYLI